MGKTFFDYFRNENEYLESLIEQFIADYPEFSDVLTLLKSDPDAQYLKEHAAFLFAKTHQKIDDAFPEITQNLLQRLWQTPLKPLPSTTIVQFCTDHESVTLPANSALIADTQQWVTCSSLQVLPMRLSSVALTDSKHHAVLRFTLFFEQSEDTAHLYDEGGISLYLGDDPALAGIMQLYLTQYVEKSYLILDDDSMKLRCAMPVFSMKPSTDNLQTVIDHFTLPFKRHFIQLQLNGGEIPSLFLRDKKQLTFEILFSKPFPESVKPILLPNCVVAENRFTTQSDKLAFGQSQYSVKPPQNALICDISDIKLMEIDDEEALEESSITIKLLPATEFMPQYYGENQHYFYYVIQEKDTIGNLVYRLHFIDEKGLPVNIENSELLFQCTYLCTRFDGQSIGTETSCTLSEAGENLTASFISSASESRFPIICSHRHWELINHLSFNLNLLTPEVLADILHDLDLYKNSAEFRRHPQLSGIKNCTITGIDWIIRGRVERGAKLTLTLNETHFQSIGEMYQFGYMIAELLLYYIDSTSFLITEIKTETSNEIWDIPLRKGARKGR